MAIAFQVRPICLRTKWQANENSFGAYSYTAIGTEMRHFDDLAEEINDKIFFLLENTQKPTIFNSTRSLFKWNKRSRNKIIAL